MSEVSRSTAPAPLAEIPFNIARPQTAVLENGLRVIVFPDDRLPLVSIRLAFFFGDIDDPTDKTGFISAMTSLMTEGTQNYSSRELAEKVERLGASLSAGSSDDFTTIKASGLSIYFNDLLELVEEVLLRPTFPANEVDLYKRNTIEGLKVQRSQPTFLAQEQSARLVFGSHPYGTITPTQSDIEKITPHDLAEIRDHKMIPNNAFMVVVGDVEASEVIEKVKNMFGTWQGGDIVGKSLPALPERDHRTITIVDRPGSAQTNIVLTTAAVKRTDPDYFPILLMNQILGAGASSRVFMNLREEKGYTYGAYTRFDMRRFAGSFEATAEVRTAVTGDSLKEFFYELERIRDEAVPEEELQDAKNFLMGVFPIRAETQEGLTGLILSQNLYDLPEDYLDTYRENIANVSADDVAAAAKKYICPDKMAIVLVGDAAELIEQSKPFADSVEIFDADGHKKNMEDYTNIGETQNIAGVWNLAVELSGQTLPVTLTLKQDGEDLSGTIDAMLGSSHIDEGKIKGNRFTLASSTERAKDGFQFNVIGEVSDGVLSGSVTTPLMPEALTFTGTKD